MTDLTLWPFLEAKKIITSGREDVIFETGYGPSGLPHIGTFGEVARTSYVKKAYEYLTGKKSRLIAFSDDMDALRKVPDNVPNKEMMEQYIGFPLTSVPDPFQKYDSFAAHNNAKLCMFLDAFGFEYEFISSTECYKSGRFNDALKRLAECHEEVCKAVRPTLRGERAKEWSPFMPICPKTGKVMMVELTEVDAVFGTVSWFDEAGDFQVTSIYDGNCKIQWKADWALRWYALGISYEMSGKDLIDSVKLSSKIVRILGGTPPINLTYELFLDENGEKISKSKGNGLTIDEWFAYGDTSSLEQMMFNKPQTAKKLYAENVPKLVDEYITNQQKGMLLPEELRPTNPAWFFNNGRSFDKPFSPVPYSMIINVASIAATDDEDVILDFLKRYNPDCSFTDYTGLRTLCESAIYYYKKFVEPNKEYREPTDLEREALVDLLSELQNMDSSICADDIQTKVFEVGKRYYDQKELRKWFGCLYEVLMGQKEGPRFGIFTSIYGLENTINLIIEKLKG